MKVVGRDTFLESLLPDCLLFDVQFEGSQWLHSHLKDSQTMGSISGRSYGCLEVLAVPQLTVPHDALETVVT